MNTWDSLDIEWSDFHQDARKVVNDPKLWDTAHDFAPNGNDSGFDLFHAFKESGSVNSKDQGKSFYRQIFHSWGVDPNAKPGDGDYKYKRLMIIGMAFSYLKLGAYCPAWLADESLHQLDEFKVYIARVDPGWDLKEFCYEYYDACYKCIKNSRRSPTDD